MILSVSRRTDIPTYYSEWFLNRIREGYVMVRNPMNYHQVSKIKITPDVVDGIVFWTKNPAPFLPRLKELVSYHYYFQFTLNSYAADIEPGIPFKGTHIIPTFQRLSERIGPGRVIWRYDPILLSETYTIDYHIKYFERLARLLHNHTQKCTISFIDLYRNTRNNVKGLGMTSLNEERKVLLAGALSEIARSYGLEMDTCAEDAELETYGATHARCVDSRLIEKISGHSLKVEKDKHQRPACGCMTSIDVGAYNTCRSGCKYCYANHSPQTVNTNSSKHIPTSPLLCGELTKEDRVTERVVKSCRGCSQQNIFIS